MSITQNGELFSICLSVENVHQPLIRMTSWRPSRSAPRPIKGKGGWRRHSPGWKVEYSFVTAYLTRPSLKARHRDRENFQEGCLKMRTGELGEKPSNNPSSCPGTSPWRNDAPKTRCKMHVIHIQQERAQTVTIFPEWE